MSRKRYVNVIAKFEDSAVYPLCITTEKKNYPVQIIDIRPIHTLENKEGITLGTRYKIASQGVKRYLFYDAIGVQWFTVPCN